MTAESYDGNNYRM